MKLLDLEKQKDDKMGISPFLHKEIHFEMIFFHGHNVSFGRGVTLFILKGVPFVSILHSLASMPPRLAIGRMVSVV